MLVPITRRSPILAIDEEVHLTQLGKQYANTYLYFEFSMIPSMELANLVVPTSGIAIPTASENGFYWGKIKTLNNLGTIDLSTMGDDYERASIGGIVEQLKVNLLGVTGANFYRVTVMRS